MIPIEDLTAPLSGDDPCGEDLSSGTSMIELEALIAGKPESQFSAAEPPDWRKVRQTCLDLFGRSRDLRVAVDLCLALTCTEGLSGLRDGLTVLHRLLANYWGSLYPKLDPDDNNDPAQRMNIIADLGAPVGKFGDSFRFIERLQTVPLTNSPQFGRLTYGAISEARRGPPPKGAPAAGTIDPAQIDAAFRDTPVEEVELTFKMASDALEQLKAIEATLNEKAGSANTANLSEFEKSLVAIRSIVRPFVREATNEEEKEELKEKGNEKQKEKKDGISSRDDVLKVLQDIRAFYAKHEPASPIPLLINRIERMVPMSFLELMNEMAPDSLKNVNSIIGPQPK